MMINSLVISFGGLYVPKAVNSIGAYFTAGTEVSGTVFSVLEAVIMAIQTSTCVFVGQNLGAGQPKRIRDGVRKVVWISSALTLVLITIVFVFRDQIVGLLLSNNDPELFTLAHTVAVRSIYCLIGGMIIMTPMYLYRASLQTIGYPQYAMYAGFAQVIARIGTVIFLPPLLGEYAYYLPTVIAWLFTVPIVVIPYHHYINDMCQTESLSMDYSQNKV